MQETGTKTADRVNVQVCRHKEPFKRAGQKRGAHTLFFANWGSRGVSMKVQQLLTQSHLNRGGLGGLRRLGGFLGWRFLCWRFLLRCSHDRSSRVRSNRYHKKPGAWGILARLDRLLRRCDPDPRRFLSRRVRCGGGHLRYDYRPMAGRGLSRGVHSGNQENGARLRDGGTR